MELVERAAKKHVDKLLIGENNHKMNVVYNDLQGLMSSYRLKPINLLVKKCKVFLIYLKADLNWQCKHLRLKNLSYS